MLRSATIYRYRIMMHVGHIMQQQCQKAREGFLVKLQNGDRIGMGEIAPLYGFSPESLAQAEIELMRILPQWCNDQYIQDSHLASVAFGLSCAMAELEHILPWESLYCSTPLFKGDVQNLDVYQWTDLAAAKVKVGSSNIQQDAILIQQLIEKFPKLSLRLDANRHWTLSQAMQFFNILPSSVHNRICWIEEPCQNPDDSWYLSQQMGVAIAWDETLREEGFQLTAKTRAAAAIVIKPMLQGSLKHCQQLILHAQTLGIIPIISSSLESSLGLTQLSRMATWLTPQELPGLDTLEMMNVQLLRAWPNSMLPLLALQDLEQIWHHTSLKNNS